MKKICALYDVEADGEILKKGTILEVVDVVENQIVVRIPDGEFYAMSSEDLESGFEIAET